MNSAKGTVVKYPKINFLRRLATGFILTLLFMVFLKLSKAWCVVSLTGIAMLSVQEMVGIFANQDVKKWTQSRYQQIGLWGVVLLLMIGLMAKFPWVLMIWGVVALLWSCYIVVGSTRTLIIAYPSIWKATQLGLVVMLGVFFHGVMHLHQNNQWLLISVVMITAFSDVSGYCVGKVCGGQKAFPKLSPNKTISGSVAMVLVPVPLAMVMQRQQSIMWVLACSGILVLFGDLWMSQIKRISGIKDTGNILPGHGGILDRIDSHMVTMTAVMVFKAYHLI